MLQDIIFIHGLKVSTFIGCLAWEKDTPRILILDIDMQVDTQRAAQSDDIHLTVDYAAVAERIKIYVQESRFKLVETLGEQLAQVLLKEFPLVQVTLKINKTGAVADAQAVGILITRRLNN